MEKKIRNLELICEQCNKEFTRHLSRFEWYKSTKGKTKRVFCSRLCFGKFNEKAFIEKSCKYCSKKVRRRISGTKNQAKNIFCNSSCAASYNNTLKRASRRSKVEIMLFEMLEKEFPNIKFIPNDKKMLDGFEADIAIPSLKLAIEWNGIIHFKPIYGQAKLNKIQSNDAKKQIIAQKKGINLIAIPDLVSTKARVKQAFVSVSKIIRQLTN